MTENMTYENFPEIAVESVVDSWEESGGEGRELTEAELFVVWFTYVLGNWKALVSTHRYKGHYWEVTYNGAKDEIYVDKYVKQNQVILEA